MQANFSMFKEKLTNLFVRLRRICTFSQSSRFNPVLKRICNKKERLVIAPKLHNCVYRWLSYRDAATNYKNALRHEKLKFVNAMLPAMLIDNAKLFWNAINPRDSADAVLKIATGDTSNYNHFTSSFYSTNIYTLPLFPEPNFALMNDHS